MERVSHGIRRKLLLYFALFAAVALALFWLCATVFLDDIYRMIKVGEITSAADKIAEKLTDTAGEDVALSLASDRSLCVVAYRMNGDAGGLELFSCETFSPCAIHEIGREGRYAIYRRALESDGELLTGLVFDPKTSSYVSPPAEQKTAQGENLVCARVVQKGNATYFLLLNSLLTPVASTVNTMIAILCVISVLLLLLSVLLAWIVSRRIAKPLSRVNEASRRLAARDYDLRLHETAYREVSELSESLNYAGQELSKVDGLARELISNISHDLRTPLTMITGYAEVMRDIPGENTPENVQVIIDESNRLSSLVSDVLDLSRFTSGNAPVEKKPFNLTASVRATLLRYQKLAARENYHIDFRFTSDVTVESDEVRLTQALCNLVNNALTYTGESRTVTVEQTVSDGHVRLSVTDYGQGIPPEELPFIFDRYYRAAPSHRRPAAGNGLGLAIVKAVMDQLGGTYGVVSRPSMGCTFWIEI